MRLFPNIEKIRESISRREDDFRIRIGATHVSHNRNLEKTFENLWDAEVKVFSQWGEDGILDFLFECLGISKPRILELGAGSFAECNSRFAAHIRNASVYAVDSRRDLPNGLRKSGLMWRNNLHCEVIEIDDENILDIIERAKSAMNGIDTVSVDLDGNDYWLLEQIPLAGISIVVVEYNPIFGASLRISVENQKKSRFERHYSGLLFGASLSAFISLLNEKNFTFVGTNRVGNNAFFVKTELVDHCKVKVPNSSRLERYVDWRCREARDKNKVLTYADIKVNLNLLQDCKIVDIETGEKFRIRELVK